MTPPPTTDPADFRPAAGPAELLADAQRRTMQSLTVTSAILGPIVAALALWPVFLGQDRSILLYIGIAAILGGSVAQFLLRRRLTVEQAAYLFLTWLMVMLVTAMLHLGPLLGLGGAWAVSILIAIFFIGQRAGLILLLGYAAIALLQMALVQAQILPYPHEFARAGGMGVLIRTYFGGLAALVLCLAAFSIMHGALRRALYRMAEEKQQRDQAEAARLRAEETMKANQHFEALGKLASGVAHDVNNALTSVLGHAELLSYSLPPGEEQLYTQDIIAAARSAAHTTRQLLGLNRRAATQPASIPPSQVVETVSRLIQRLLPEHIQVEVDCRSERLVLVDPADLQQALLNLVLNARDALPRGGRILLRVTDHPAPDGAEGHIVQVEVTDNGHGIAPDVLPRIFEPFFTTKPVGHGTGLGLAMVRLFMDEAGGQVRVASQPGRGTTVTLTFPESHLPADAPAHRPDATATRSNQRVLVVEDQPELGALMERVLSRGGYAVRVVPSPEGALAALAGPEHFDLLCTDGVIGTTPVHTVIDKFRARAPRAPVLVCTGHLDDELVRHGIAVRELNLLRKPFTGTELLARVRKALEATD